MGDKVFISRRRFLQAGAALSGAMLLPGVMQAAWAAGSDKPELATVRVGFIPLTDCAPLAIAALKGFDKKYGISLQPSKEASWAAVRDKLVAGELDAAHILYGMLYGLELGIAGKPQQMANLMTLNRNGQAITLSSDLQAQGVSDSHGLKRLIDQKAPGSYTFAHTFPTGTHAMWLYYWLANTGIDPFADVRMVVVPPPQMVMNMRIGNMVGFCVGEPWNARAINDRIGFTAATSQQIWADHPEKSSARAAIGWRATQIPQGRWWRRCWRPSAGLKRLPTTPAKPRGSSPDGRGSTPKNSTLAGACLANTTMASANAGATLIPCASSSRGKPAIRGSPTACGS